jgi:hypothetical protein
MPNRKMALWVTAAMMALVLSLAGCATTQGPSRQAYQGGAVGAGVGAAAGALIDKNNRWRGGVIGAGLGAILGGALGQISNRAAQEAAYQQRPVVYTNAPGTQRVEAAPVGRKGNCRIVKEKYYEHGQLVKETEREVCD